ncbi:hypothetical protein VTN00DRAFT_5415 [Thermoascus crustaceus]|uniref:uncharacterized protein n=1 Tax=Thermoascus crustaceus TaxID=5088 RepID=UPI0037432A00
MNPGTGSVTQLLEKIQASTKVYLDFFKSQNLPEASYEHGDGLDPRNPLPQEILAAKDTAIEATDELHHLLLGPLGMLLSSPGDQYLLLSLQYIYRYRIAYNVPLDSSITFEELAKASGLNVKDAQKGSVVHTATSKLLLNNPMLAAWILNIAEEFWPSLTRTVDATEKWPGSEEPNETGYSLSHNTTENPFDVIKKDPKRQRQFIDAMSYSHLHSSYNISHLIENYDFGSIGNGTIVDVVGSHGQDLPDTIAGLDIHVPEELKGRVQGVEHDFLTPQPVKEPGQLGIGADRGLRLMDISIKAFNNARERDVETWVSLFTEADPRFQFLGITMPPGARMAIIQAEWTGK